MTAKRFVALDPGLATFGFVAADVSRDGAAPRGTALHERVRVTCADVFDSDPSTTKLGADLAADRVARTRALRSWLAPKLAGAHLVAAEAMSFPRSAVSITMISLAWGVICAEIERLGIPLVTAYPTTWRKHLVRNGVEEDAHAEAVRRVPSFVRHGRGITRGLQVHALDAHGVLVWSLSTREAGMVLR